MWTRTTLDEVGVDEDGVDKDGVDKDGVDEVEDGVHRVDEDSVGQLDDGVRDDDGQRWTTEWTVNKKRDYQK